MEFEITFEEIYSDEIALTKQIIDIVKVNKNNLFYNTFVFGAKYKAYLNNDNRYVVCSCEKKSIENRIKLYKQQFELNGEWKYYDYVYDKHIDNPTLEYFLGLPKELDIDYSKDIVSQITFEDNICHRCCGVDYQFLTKKGKKTNDKRRDIEKENYFFEKGFHYVPIYKKSYVLLDELCDEDKENLQFDLNDFNVKDKVCVGYQTFIDNPDKENQIEQLKKFLTLPLDKQLNALYIDHKELRNELTLFKDSDYDFYNKIEQVCNKKVRELQSKHTYNFPVSTSPAYLLTQFYRMLIEDGFDYMTENYEYVSEREIEDFTNEEYNNYNQYLKFVNLITKLLNQYINFGGDTEITYYGKDKKPNKPFTDLLFLINDKKIADRVGIIIDKLTD